MYTDDFSLGVTQANASGLVGNLQIGALPVSIGTTGGTGTFGICNIMENGVSFSSGCTMLYVLSEPSSTLLSIFESGGTSSFGAMPVADIGPSVILLNGSCYYH